ncbi:peptidase S24/S26A/S26B/S26C [Microdochium trichocladiopsis]|uniref:Peptidase S24/S26A/S26B/S26C n=1 Tax=Microdochium trichocladiopsis TaxID=1682393 RepID=A0A9P9BRM6_9PEZI|nr:peptidase S24/S26A/S26B/S26C [Microdochium trichocladiopsis]KAH7033086.1 peptidase S24/S26A/S26B/S26C [Microdochium trichocladiopsis]
MAFLGHPIRVTIIAGQWLALTHLITTYGFTVGPGSGPSMLPTFSTADEWILVNKSYRRGRNVAVGDCVTFVRPVENGGYAVKRIMGMPGDYVLLNSPNHLGASDNMIQVPKGHVFLVGDNLDWSRDSRDYGPISMGLIQGKVTHKITMDGWWVPGWFSKVSGGLRSPTNGF